MSRSLARPSASLPSLRARRGLKPRAIQRRRTMLFEPLENRSLLATIAYSVAAGQAGNQNFGGSLGMDFDVTSPITVTSLGAFDAGSNGISGTINVRLYNRAAPGVPLVAAAFSGTAQQLIGGSRFSSIAALNLPAGFQGRIVADGYNGAELNGNGGPWTTNTGGALTFTGGGFYDVAAGTYPNSADGGPANRYAAGTFAFVNQPITTTYADDSFSIYSAGQIIPDADPGTAGNQPGVFGVDSFTTIAAAVAASAANGTTVVSAGSYPETITLSGTKSLRISGPAEIVTLNSLTTAAGQNLVLEGTANLIVGDATNTTIAGVISGGGSLTKQGAGTLQLSGINTYTGGTTVNGGILQLTGGTPAPGNIVINSGGRYSMATNTFNGHDLSKTITINAGGTMSADSATNNAYNIGPLVMNGGTLTSANGLAGPANDGGFGNWLLRGVTIGGSAVSTISATQVNIVSGSFNVADSVAGAGTDLLVSGRIIGGTLIKTGVGTLQLSGANTYAGGTTLSQGTIQVENATGLGTSIVTLNDAATAANNTSLLTSLSGATIGNALVVANQGTGVTTVGSNGGATATTFSGTVTLNKATTFQGQNADRTSYNNIISGNPGTITVSGGGRTTWGGNNTFGGNIDIQGAGTILQPGASSSTNEIPDTASVNVGAGAIFQLAADDEAIDGLTGTGTVRPFNGTGNRVLSVGANNGSSSFGGIIQDNGNTLALTKVGSGTITLTGANTYSGATRIISGTLVAANNSALGTTTGNTLVSDGATLALQGNLNIAEPILASGSGVSGAGAIRNISGTSTLTAANPNAAIPVALQNGAGTFSQGGFSPAAMIDGDLTVNAGGWANAGFGSNVAVFETAADLNLLGIPTQLTFSLFSGGYGNHTIGRFRISVTTDPRSTFADGLANGGDVTATWTELVPTSVTAANGTTYTIQGDNSVLASGADPGTETTTFRATTSLQNITGVRIETIQDASLPALGPGRAGNGNYVIIEWNVATSSASTTIGSDAGLLTLSGNMAPAAASALVFTGAGDTTVSGNILGPTTTLTKNGGGTLILSGTNTYTGATTINAGVLQVGAAGTTGTLGAGPVVDNASLIFNRTNAYAVTNSISGSGTLTQNGTGTTTLSATNTYAGTTTVNAGVLQLQNGAAILDAAGAVSVANGATLQLLNSETISSYNGSGDLVGTNDSTLILGGNTLTTTGSAAIANVTSAAGGGIISGGNITDTDDDNNITGPDIYLQAATGIGAAGNPIETAVSGIQLRNTTSGVINVINRVGGLLTVSDLRALGFGVRNDGGATTVINSSPLIIAAPSVSVGPVLIEARDNGSVVNADFNTSDGGFSVVNGGPVEDPWTYDPVSGRWFTNGTQNQGTPAFSELNSASSTVTVAGNVTLSFRHRYSFEFDGTRWDGGQVRISVNGGAFTTVPAGSFSQGGYDGVITGNNVLTGQQGFNGDSPGYGTGALITSVANLGAFVAGDTIRVQFVGAWDEFAEGTNPNWEIDAVSVFTPSAAAGDNLTISALVQSTGSSVTLNAGDDLTVNAPVTSATFTMMNVDYGNSDAGAGGSLTIAAAVTTPVVGSGGGTFLSGNTDNDTFTFSPQTTTEFRVLGDLPTGTATGDTLALDVSGTTGATLTIPGTVAPYNGPGSGAWSFTSAHRPVLFSSIEQSSVTGNHHLIYDNSVSPVANIVVMRDTALPTANLQLRDGSTIGNIIYQGTMASILSLRILGSAGSDTVTVDDINTLPDFGGTVPGVTDNPNLGVTAELLFDGLGGSDTLVYNLNGVTASQSYAIGSGSGAASLSGEIQSTAAGVTLNAFFQNVELAQRTGVGGTPSGLTIIGDSSANQFSTAANGTASRTSIPGYTPFEFSGNNYNALTINALAGIDTLDLVGFGSGQTNNPAINLSGGSEADTIRVRSTNLNTGAITLNGGAGSDLFQLFDAANTVDNIAGPVDIDGSDGNVGGNTDTLQIVDSGDITGDNNVVLATVNSVAVPDYYLDGINNVGSSDVVFRNVDVLNYTSTAGNDVIDGRFMTTAGSQDLDTVSLSGWTGADQFLLFTSDQLGGTGLYAPTGTPSGLGSIRLYGDALGNPNGGDGNDIFGETPLGLTGTGASNVGLSVSSDTRLIRPSVTTVIAIDGGKPTGPVVPVGDTIGDVLNVDITSIPNLTPLIVSTTGPGTIQAGGISPLTWNEIEDINLVDQNKLSNVQVGDLLGRGTPGADAISLSNNSTPTNPNRIRIRINSLFGDYTVTNKTIIYAGAQNDNVTQSNLTIPAEFYGEGGNDYLSGAMNNDWLVGGDGSDQINGSGGNNIIWGDNSPTIPGDPEPQDIQAGGDDKLSGLSGNDVFYGGGGNDEISSGAGNDYAYGGWGNDTIGGNDGDDRLYGGMGNDILSGHAGNDLLSGGDNDDKLYGATGNDVLLGGSGVDLLDAGGGNDLIVSGSVANENSTWTSVANTTTFDSANYTDPADSDAALLILLTQWSSVGDRSSIAAITHDGANDDLLGYLGDDDFCWESADVTDNPPGISPSDFNAFKMGMDERFGPT